MTCLLTSPSLMGVSVEVALAAGEGIVGAVNVEKLVIILVANIFSISFRISSRISSSSVISDIFANFVLGRIANFVAWTLEPKLLRPNGNHLGGRKSRFQARPVVMMVMTTTTTTMNRMLFLNSAIGDLANFQNWRLLARWKTRYVWCGKERRVSCYNRTRAAHRDGRHISRSNWRHITVAIRTSS